MRRADGYYVQFSIDQERLGQHEPTNKMLGIDVGLNHFYTDSEGNIVENPRFLRKAEKALKRASRRASRRTKGSKNRIKAIHRLGRTHLKVSRRRKDFAVKTARALVQSADLVAIEDLAENHKRFLRRFMPAAEFEIVFDAPSVVATDRHNEIPVY